MTVFALVEVVMIVLGIVMATHFEEQKELADVKASALVLFNEVLDDLDIDIRASERIALRNVGHNATSDVLMDPNSSEKDIEQIGDELQHLLGYYTNFNIHTKGYLALKEIHDRLPPEWMEVYSELELLMDQATTIDVYNKRYQETIYETFDAHVKEYPWYVRDNYFNRISPEFLAWSTGDVCKSQTMLILNDMGNLTYVAMEYREAAIRLHELIRSTLNIDLDEAKHPHAIEPETGWLTRFVGNFRLPEGMTDVSEAGQSLEIFELDDQLYMTDASWDSTLLKRCAEATFQTSAGRSDLYHFTDDQLRLVKFGIEKDWIFDKE